VRWSKPGQGIDPAAGIALIAYRSGWDFPRSSGKMKCAPTPRLALYLDLSVNDKQATCAAATGLHGAIGAPRGRRR